MAAAVLSSMFSPVQEVRANDGIPSGCEVSWNVPPPGRDPETYDYRSSGWKECPLRVDGTPVYVYASASDRSATDPVSVTVRMFPKGNPELTFGSCEASGSGTASCRNDDVVPREISPGLFEIRLPLLAGGTGLAVTCRANFVGDRAGAAGCFGANHCPQATDLSCQQLLGERLDCVIGASTCPSSGGRGDERQRWNQQS